jgi:rod shape-determining protein MreD
MSLVLAAVGAVVAGLLELTVVPYVSVFGAHPHPVLVLGVIWTVAAGVESGLVWAFAGGLLLDVLAPRPLGSTAFALLVSLGGTSVGGRVLSRVRPLAPIPLVFVLSLVNSLLLLVAYGALRAPIPAENPIGTLLPGAVFDTLLATILGPLVIFLHDRHRPDERVDW